MTELFLPGVIASLIEVQVVVVLLRVLPVAWNTTFVATFWTRTKSVAISDLRWAWLSGRFSMRRQNPVDNRVLWSGRILCSLRVRVHFHKAHNSLLGCVCMGHLKTHMLRIHLHKTHICILRLHLHNSLSVQYFKDALAQVIVKSHFVQRMRLHRAP